MYKIGTLNKISPVGLGRLTDNYTVVEDVNDANGIILRSYDMHEMELSENLLAVGRAGAGVNNIPLDKCAEAGIVVFNSPGANANAVKELCLAGMIMAARNIPAGLAWAKTLVGSEGVGKQIEKGKGQFAGTEIMGKTLGVIGRLVANACVGLGMNVIGYDAFLTDAAKADLDPLITVVDNLSDMYPQCDYISIHVPANDATKGMINAAAFAQMKDGVKFMNFSRDKLMNDDDLLAALESGKVGTYVTDFADDTVLNADRPDIIVLPHLGASSAEAEDNCAVMAVNEVMDYLENGNIVNSVNMPAVSLGTKSGPRVSVIAKADAAAAVLAKLADLGAANVASATRGDYAYVLAEVEADEAAVAVDGVIRVRILK
ncbi:MAG: 3-phosphoglycerate dehydrogenase family protein [Bacillota bacterium]|nr:3-phosphoglycerate dehydrogenase family protein [Bacillota bacterium]